jgi:hypothetical protein
MREARWRQRRLREARRRQRRLRATGTSCERGAASSCVGGARPAPVQSRIFFSVPRLPSASRPAHLVEANGELTHPCKVAGFICSSELLSTNERGKKHKAFSSVPRPSPPLVPFVTQDPTARVISSSVLTRFLSPRL